MPLFAALDRLKADLDILRPLAPEQEQRVLQKFRLEWNYNSNAIEGNSLTLGETRSLLLHGLTAQGKPLRDHLDIRGHDEAVRGLEEMVRDERPLTEQFIREMHQVLLGEPHYKPAQTPNGQPTRKRIVPGQYKTAPNNVLTATGEVFYFASAEETPAKMTDLVDWYRHETAHPTLHPVALAAEFHYRFVRIHPFDDGNGRMSRLLMNLILLRAGYAITVIKATDRNRYLAALAEADAGEFEPFLRFVIENVESSLQLMIRAARGESVDEPDDLDKKLALLKGQLAGREDLSSATWSLATQTHLYNSQIKFWLEDLSRELDRFTDFFMNTVVRFEAIDTYRSAFPAQELFGFADTILCATDVFDSKERLVEEATFYIEWNKFRSLSTPFSQGLNIRIKFGQFAFQVESAVYERQQGGHSSSPQVVLESPYSVQPDQNLIHEINHKLANDVYDLIAMKLNDAKVIPS